MDNKKRIHFGALDLELDPESTATSLDEGVRKGNVNVSTVESETLELSLESLDDQEKHAKALQQFEEKRRSKSIVVPTDDTKVKKELRALGQPVCLFGEGPGDRRNRLRLTLARTDVDRRKSASVSTDTQEQQRHKKLFYTNAERPLVSARHSIAKDSWDRSKLRLQRLKRRKIDREEAIAFENQVAKVYSKVKGFRVEASQFGDTRPLSSCKFSYGQIAPEYIATGSFSATVSLWSGRTYEKLHSLNGHEERVVDVGFSPTSETLASAGADRVALLWKLPAEGLVSEKELEPIGKLEGHAQRLSKLAWHPLGKLLVTSSFDTTWRMWDVESSKEVLLQDGHETSVYGLSFHPDGSLLASTDLNGIGRVWDVRNGKSIFSLTGHAMQILSVDFSCNGFHIATGSGDHTARIYDLRQQKVLTTIPGHTSTVSSVQFSPQSGSFLATASYDKSIKLWSSRDFSLLRTLQGHEGKIMDIHIGADEQKLLSCSYDKTWKLWKNPIE